MFLQHLDNQNKGVRNEANIQDKHVSIKDPKTVSHILTEKVSEMQPIKPSSVVNFFCVVSPLLSCLVQRINRNKALFMPLLMQTQMVITLIQLSKLSFQWFSCHLELNVKQNKSMAYFHMSYNQLPIK